MAFINSNISANVRYAGIQTKEGIKGHLRFDAYQYTGRKPGPDNARVKRNQTVGFILPFSYDGKMHLNTREGRFSFWEWMDEDVAFSVNWIRSIDLESHIDIGHGEEDFWVVDEKKSYELYGVAEVQRTVRDYVVERLGVITPEFMEVPLTTIDDFYTVTPMFPYDACAPLLEVGRAQVANAEFDWEIKRKADIPPTRVLYHHNGPKD